MSLEVTRMPIDQILSKLRCGEWQVPGFQREFVWDQNQVFSLLHSVFKSRPVGLITLWQQPQSAPHTASEPIKLKTAKFGDFKENPAVMKLVLDGRQRLTVLAMAFGGLREASQRRLFSGKWFLNLDADSESENFIVYKKMQQVESEQLKSAANCLAKALIPLDQHTDFKDFSGNIHNTDFYDFVEVPPFEIREQRRRRLADLHEVFLKFQIPIAELPETVSLAEVCEIFDVLNTTGTKVSTFDLIHNTNYANTKGEFDLRAVFESCREDYPSLGMLCDWGRPEFFCQILTGCYLLEPDPKGRKSGETIRSLKGGDLLNTPTQFYEVFSQGLPKIDTYAAELFSTDALGGRFGLREVPYPVSLILYLSLRWAQERTLGKPQKFTVAQLNDCFRAFFWSNALSGRYDQGFLTSFSSDIQALKKILVENGKITDEAEWKKACQEQLDDHMFSSQLKRRTEEDLVALLKDGDVRGAASQALSMFLFSEIKVDFTDGELLDRFAEDPQERVQLHHIFPKSWCKDNKSHHKILDNELVVDAFVNLVPLKASSNNAWKTKAPATAIDYFGLNWKEHQKFLRQAFIDEKCFNILRKPEPDPEEFWNQRANLMGSSLFRLQKI